MPPMSPPYRRGIAPGAPTLGSVITTTGLELRAGARILISDATLRVQPGDRIGLVGRNGAGKTTTLTTLAGERVPHAGKVDVTGEIGYLPQDPRSGDLDITASDRVLSGRGLDVLRNQLVKAQIAMAEPADDAERDKAVRRYGRLEDQFAAMGGYAAESDAARICTNLGLPDRVLAQPLRTLSGGQRRRVELARILFSDAETLLLDEPTNHLDADSITWLRGFLASHRGGLIVISHDVELLEAVVNKVWHLDANRAEVDVYNLGWKRYLQQRETDERRRKQERANTERKIDTLNAQADKMRAKATKAKAAKSMDKRAERLAAGLADVRVQDKVAKLRFPTPVACGRTPLTAEGLSKSYGSLEIFTDVDLAVDRGTRVVVLGLNGAGKTTLLRMLAGTETPDTGEVKAGHGLRVGYYAQEHETIDMDRTPARGHAVGRAGQHRHRAAPDPRRLPLLRRDRRPARRHALRRRADPAGHGHAGRLGRQRAAARRADQQPRPGQPRAGARGAAHLRRRDRAGHPRRGRRARAQPRQGDPAARRHRGRLERGLRRPGVAWPVDRSAFVWPTRGRWVIMGPGMPRQRGGGTQ